MGIRGKLLFSTLLTLFLASLILVTAQFLVISPYLDGLESGLAQEKARQIQKIMEQEGRSLKQLLDDWAIWDPSYRYVTAPYPEYEKENLIASSFTFAKLSHIMIFTQEGKLRWGGSMKAHESAELIRLGEDSPVTDFFVKNRGLAWEGQGWAPLLFNNEWYLVAGEVIHSPSAHQSSGSIFMARPMDTDMLGQLSVQAGLVLHISSEGILPGNIHISQVDGFSKLVIGMQAGSTASTGPALVLETSIKRDFEKSGLNALLLSMGASLGVLFTFTLITLLILTTSLIRPLKSFSIMIKHVRTSGDYSKRIHWTSTDELGVLAQGINDLTSTIQEHTLVLSDLAKTDPLCGIGNRRSFDEALKLAWKICKREKRPLGLIMVDVDHFKLFNDTYGHRAGDASLKAIAEALDDVARRPGDLVCRYGGEEMVLLLPNTDIEGVLIVAARLCQEVRLLGIPHCRSSHGTVTVSAGGCSFVPEEDQEPEILVEMADKELYRAKAAGRNQYAPTLDPEGRKDLSS